MNSSAPARNNRILVIDDNPAIHEDFQKILRPRSEASRQLDAAEAALFGESKPAEPSTAYEIDCAAQGNDGLAAVKQVLAEGRPYALAFVDVRMPPGWDGVETVQHLWQADPEIQIVLCTAYSDYSWEHITRKLGESDNLLILKKPFDNIEVLQLAQALTCKWQLNRQARARMEDLDRMVAVRTEQLSATNAKLEQEISDRRIIEEALRLSEERFGKAFRNNPLPMLIYTSNNSRCMDANAQFITLLGLDSQPVVGRKLADLNMVADRNLWHSLNQQVLRQHSVRDLQCAFLTQSGEQRDTLVWAERIDLATEPCVLLILEDVTDRRRLESQLQQAQKMEAVGQLASGVAHDFNNILTVIQGHIELVLMNKLEPHLANSLKQAGAAASRATALTRQLLTFSRKQAVQPCVINLNDQILALKSMLARLIGEHIHLRCVCVPDSPPVFADPCNLEQIVMNLAVNARDAMPRGGELTVTTRVCHVDERFARSQPNARPGLYVCLSVTDTGCGIAPELMPRIFEPFFTTKEVGKGTGLGLATVYGIVRSLNGWIEVSSTPDQGSAFTVFLPAHVPEGRAHAREPAESPTSHKSATILVVEDEDSVRELTCKVIADAGHNVLSASDGPEALKVWNAHSSSIDLLFTDIVMPNGVSGRDLARKLQADRSDLKVLFTSGYSSELIGKDSLIANGHRFVPKPFSPKALVTAIHESLNGDL